MCLNAWEGTLVFFFLLYLGSIAHLNIIYAITTVMKVSKVIENDTQKIGPTSPMLILWSLS